MPGKRLARKLGHLYRMLRPRSQGLPVSREVKRGIRFANAAQKAGDWPGAAAAYAAVVADAPYLSRIWVQYGHMLRETGRRSEARAAYEHAVALEPQMREPHLLLVRLARAEGDRAATFAHAHVAFRHDPADRQTRTTLLQAASAGEPGQASLLAEIAASLGIALPLATPAAEPSVRLFLDVGDLIAHFVGSRLPSGLQRVEIEVTRAALAMADADLALCCWSPAAAAWKPLSPEKFLALVDAAAGNEDAAAWDDRVSALLLALACAGAIDFPAGSTLLNLGMAWGDASYHPAVAREKACRGLRYAAIACDVIPLVRPQDVPHDIVTACAEWLDAMAEVADAVIAISAATRDDLVEVSALRGKPIAAERIGVARLDAVFAPSAHATADALARHRLEPGGYALYVSTVEPRKNHLGALEAWRLLMDDSTLRLPDLVCVGRTGWRSEMVTAMLAGDRALAGKVHLLSLVSDGDLDQLLRHCAFAFYPSLYEGWGLPVTEALAHGKVPVVGDNSSLPEAGGPFAIYVDAGSPAAMAATIAPLLQTPALLEKRERTIRSDFAPRAWAAVAADMIAIARGAAVAG